MALVSSLLLRAQRRLGLSPTQLAVLMQLCDFWWDSERKPYPSKATRLGLSPRQVQRHVAELETAGIVRRTQRRLIPNLLFNNLFCGSCSSPVTIDAISVGELHSQPFRQAS